MDNKKPAKVIELVKREDLEKELEEISKKFFLVDDKFFDVNNLIMRYVSEGAEDKQQIQQDIDESIDFVLEILEKRFGELKEAISSIEDRLEELE